MINNICPACHATDFEVFYELDAVPIQQNTPKIREEEAYLTPKGTIVLACCKSCGFVSNLAFDPNLEIYTTDYNNVQSHSPTFQSYVDNIASMLLERYTLYDKKIIEIGHGKGDFLVQLCTLGNNQGIGFDPSYSGISSKLDGRVQFISDFYGVKYSQYSADLFVARHLIEHVQNLDELVGEMRHAIGDKLESAVFFETPDIRWILENVTFWDIFYEHCSLFSLGSIARLFARHHFDIIRVSEAFSGQYIWLEARPSLGEGKIPDGLDTPKDILNLAKNFKMKYQEKIKSMQLQLSEFERNHIKSAVWGAGAKGVTFLNTLKPSHELVPIVVDINPEKQNRFIPGTAQKIIAPKDLNHYDIGAIFVMNPNYLSEIEEQLDNLGFNPRLISI